MSANKGGGVKILPQELKKGVFSAELLWCHLKVLEESESIVVSVCVIGLLHGR